MAVYLCSCGPSESLEQISVQSQPSYPGGSTWYFKQGKVAQHRDKSSSHHYLALRNIISDRHYDAETTNNMFCSASSAGVKMVTFTGPVIYLWLFGGVQPLPHLNLIFYIKFISPRKEGGMNRGTEDWDRDHVSRKGAISTFCDYVFIVKICLFNKAWSR